MAVIVKEESYEAALELKQTQGIFRIYVEIASPNKNSRFCQARNDNTAMVEGSPFTNSIQGYTGALSFR